MADSTLTGNALERDYFSGYQVDSVVFYGDPTRIYRAKNRSSNATVMLKTLRDESAAREAVALLQHEFEVARRLKVPSVVKVFALKRHNNLPLIELEDFGGDSLDKIIRLRRLSIEELLKISIQVAQGLIDIHGANIIHKDINPSNIVYNPATGVAKIIDFGISTHLTREQAALTSPEVFEGSLPYISPEQTGRMNRSIDYRTDFYSFGATLYELLTGRLLFIVSEPIEWFHCHIARQPVPPEEVNPDIPKPLSDIVMKLIAKTAEARYQSAQGIQADLQHCLDTLTDTGNIAPFELANRDASDRFQIPQRLYGRQREVAQLMANFEKVSRGHSRLILISGYSGIGKTCLVREIYKPITKRRGHFVSGKFEQLKRNIPYSALSAALRDLVRQLLTEPENQLVRWRDKILTAVGENGQLMIDINRELKLIIGPQPNVPEVSPLEAEQRFHRVFQRFIQVFCQPEHPLVMFLDDLQWADSSSIRLLELLTAKESDTTHLLLIGAYRDNEVPEAHPVAIWLKEMRTGKQPPDEIRLAPLTREHLSELLAETLGAQPENLGPIVDIVAHKTAGNPFFTEEFLKALYQKELIFFDRETGRWNWDIERIHAQQMTDNVVELMTARLQRLVPESRKLMELAACIGFRFPLSVLAVVSQEDPAAVARGLREGVESGLIAPIGDGYQLLELEHMPEIAEVTVEFAFAHDRIHQAAYSLLDDRQRRETHLKIGRLLQERLLPAMQQERLFEITNHLNMGSKLIDTHKERDMLCRLNLSAGKHAKSANAYQAAYDYLQTARSLLDTDAWQTDHPLAIELNEKTAEAAYLTGAYETMDDLLAAGFSRTENLLDKVELYQIKIAACMARGQPLEAIDIAKTALAQLGYHFPATPNKLHVILKLIQVKRRLRGKSINDLRNLPEMTDPIRLAAEKIGGRIGGAAMFAQPLLLPLIVLHSVKDSVENGFCPTSLVAYAAFGMVLAESLGEVDRGVAFGRLALELMEKHQIKATKGRIQHIYNALVRHWKEPICNSLAPLHEAFCNCLESGDFEYAAHAVVVRQWYAFESGLDLNDLFKETTDYHAAVTPLRQGPRIYYLKSMLQLIDNLQGNAENPVLLKGRYYDIDEMRPVYEKSGDKSLSGTDNLNQIKLSYLFGNHRRALGIADSLKAGAELGTQGMFCHISFLFYDALIRLANVPDATKQTRRRLLRQVARNLAKLKGWAKSNPANCMNKVRLVEAERLRVSGRKTDAHGLYGDAIRLAREQGFIHEEALANELYGKMHAASSRYILGKPFLCIARDLYHQWGASAKVEHLEQSYPQLIEKVQPKKGGTTSWGTSHACVDIGSLIKALKAIAVETVHSRMVGKIIATAMEFAGAQQGALILRNAKGKLCIEAEAHVDDGEPNILQSIPIESGKLPQAVVNFITRTRSSIVIHDAQLPNDQIPGLNQDAYIVANKIRSLLCLPILTDDKQTSKMIGMLYLENNLASGTFTQERFETLEIICLAAAGRLELSRKAIIDGLTQLYNHDYFQNILGQEFTAARRHGHSLSLILIDIDHFKRFNDLWGHQVGDQVLKEVADAIKSSCRSRDTVARYGGEEMVVILPATPKDKAELVAQRIRATVENHRVAHNDKQLKVTISLGLASMDPAMADKEVLIRRADTALYRSKANGRNRLTIA